MKKSTLLFITILSIPVQLYYPFGFLGDPLGSELILLAGDLEHIGLVGWGVYTFWFFSLIAVSVAMMADHHLGKGPLALRSWFRHEAFRFGPVSFGVSLGLLLPILMNAAAVLLSSIGLSAISEVAFANRWLAQTIVLTTTFVAVSGYYVYMMVRDIFAAARSKEVIRNPGHKEKTQERPERRETERKEASLLMK